MTARVRCRPGTRGSVLIPLVSTSMLFPMNITRISPYPCSIWLIGTLLGLGSAFYTPCHGADMMSPIEAK